VFEHACKLGLEGMAIHGEYGSPTDPRIKYRHKLLWEDSAMSSDLTELGQEAIAAVSRGIADGAPLVKCQLLASAFYEALRHELRQADATKRSNLLAVTRQCHRGAAANISPVQALHELKRAVDLLQPVIPAPETVQPVPRSRPVLRVIQGRTFKQLGQPIRRVFLRFGCSAFSLPARRAGV
jgi:hypothetical protein